ncbi:MAG: hypothetical protein GY856_14000, partial [bacterium]|nr:hypothetical protein [bacterium]
MRSTADDPVRIELPQGLDRAGALGSEDRAAMREAPAADPEREGCVGEGVGARLEVSGEPLARP